MKTFRTICLSFAALLSAQWAIVDAAPIHLTVGRTGAEGRQMYGTAVVGDYLYLIGGNEVREGKPENDFYSAEVSRARIQANGTLGEFGATTPLPRSRSYINNTTLVLGRTIYVVQGLDGEADEKYRTIAWSNQMDAEGNLSPWQESSAAPALGVSCSVAIAAGRRIHLLGGSVGSGQPQANVYTATLNEQGAVTGWIDSMPLPFPLWFHSAGIHNNVAYVWGGLRDPAATSVNTTLLRASVAADGSLGPWGESPKPLEFPHYAASCAVSGNYLLSFAPRYSGGAHSGDIVYGLIGADGSIRWARLDAQIPVQMYNAVAADTGRGNVYLPGGRLTKRNYSLDPTVYLFKLSAGGRGTSTAAAARPSASAAAAANPTGAPSGFITLDEAKARYASNPAAVVMFFHDKGAESLRQLQLLAGQSPAAAAPGVLFVSVDTATAAAVASQYQVQQCPAWLIFDKQGKVVVQKAEPMTPEMLMAAVQLVK